MTSNPKLPLESAAQRRARDADRLVAAARAGEPGAFDLLVRRFRPRIYALALHMCGSASEADDITQDAFVRAFRHIQQFEGRSEFFTWLYRITMRMAIDVQRAQKRSDRLIDDVRLEQALRIDAPQDPRLALELRETYTALLLALDALPPSLKSAVVLTSLQGLSYQEAAVILNTSEGAIAVRIHEARKLMRAALERRSTPRQRAASAGSPQMSEWQELAFALASLI